MKVTSERKAAAARANGARSRGPVTSHGKRRSSRNAIKHGILAKTIVPEGEDLRRFTALVKSYCDRLRLRDESEFALVHKLVEASWRLQRLRNFEGHTLAGAPIPAEPTPLDRYFATLLRTHSRLLHHLIERAVLPRAQKLSEPNEPITSSPEQIHLKRTHSRTHYEPTFEPRRRQMVEQHSIPPCVYPCSSVSIRGPILYSAARYHTPMNRRGFLGTGLSTPAALLLAQQGPAREERVETMTPDPEPAIALNHLGFTPRSPKTVIFRGAEANTFSIRDVAANFHQTLPLKPAATDVIDCLTGDFSAIDREGMYQITIAGERSVPFFVRPDVWRRTLPKAVGYYRYQRCGVGVPGVHPACHLDDARRRDNGEHVDLTGGWHDAGDLRKWMDATLMNVIGLLRLAPILEEVRWGNRYFLKMQDADGLVWADAAGGVNGDNSDNHWTDNRTGTAGDRCLNPARHGRNQAIFTCAEAMMAQAFQSTDAAGVYPLRAQTCRTAAERWRDAVRELTYRYFMPVRKQFWWLGMTSHLECYAVLLATAARVFESHRFDWRTLEAA